MRDATQVIAPENVASGLAIEKKEALEFSIQGEHTKNRRGQASAGGE